VPNPTSYSWAATLQNAVPIGEAATIATPGFNDPANYDVPNAQVVYGGEVLDDDEFTATWAPDWSSVSILNDSDEEWPPQDTIAIAVAGLPFDPSNLEQTFTQMQAAIAANSAEIEVLHTRSISNEASIAALDARITTLEDQFEQVDQTLIPHVTSQYYDSVSLAAYAPENRVQMVASNSPTSWEIVSETKNNIPTPGYWVIDGNGSVALLPEGAAAFVAGDVTVVQVRATNDNGHGDGSLTMYLTA
jgi:hypothetical protein